MDLHPEACSLLETKVSLASLGQPAGVCGSPPELCVELTLTVEMAGSHKGADMAMDVPRHPVPSDSSLTERTREGNVLCTGKQVHLCSAIFAPYCLYYLWVESPLPRLRFLA